MNRYLISLAITTIIFGAAACAPKEEPTPTPPTESHFRLSETIPQRYDKSKGLAFYGEQTSQVRKFISDLGENAPQDPGNFFIMLSSKSPTEAILVKAPQALPEQAYKTAKSSQIIVNGPTKFINCPALDEYVKNTFGATLAHNSAGNLAYIEAEEPFDLNLPEEESSESSETPTAPNATNNGVTSNESKEAK